MLVGFGGLIARSISRTRAFIHVPPNARLCIDKVVSPPPTHTHMTKEQCICTISLCLAFVERSSGGKRPSDQAKAQAQFQCAPSVFVPGTQKGASTFLFHAISFHPQVP